MGQLSKLPLYVVHWESEQEYNNGDEIIDWERESVPTKVLQHVVVAHVKEIN